MAISRLFQLSGSCNNYPWGKKGRDSLAARLCEKTPGTGFSIKDDEPYSEMWFGDYPDYPAKVLETGEPLGDVLKKHQQELLGAHAIRDLGAQLPFLPKILSIAKALPLQIHPNKKLAEQLHQKDPENFTDPNHKPEIAIALSEFEVFAGWKPLSDISPLFNIPSLRQFIPAGTTQWTNETLRQVTKELLQADGATIRAIEKDLSGITQGPNSLLLSGLGGHHHGYIAKLLPRLQNQYGPTDPGTLVALICMNYLVLQPGQALYIPADGIHAYLSGDIVECMARSNNVLNTGFCPPADRNSVDLFASALTFEPATLRGPDGSGVLLPSEKSNEGVRGHTVVYHPPISEFDALRINLQPGEDEEIRAQRGPGVAIVTKGDGGTLSGDRKEFKLTEGYIFFVAPGTSVTWRAGDSEMEVYMALVP